MVTTITSGYRDAVLAAIKPLLPKSFKLLAYQTDPDALSVTQPVAMLGLKTIEPHPEAPLGVHLVTYSLILIEPKTELGVADDALEDKLVDLILAIDAVPGLRYTKAERVTLVSSNPGFDLAITYSFTKGTS